MNAIFNHIQNSTETARDALVDSCYQEIEKFTNKQEKYSILDSLSMEGKKEYLFNFQNTLESIRDNEGKYEEIMRKVSDQGQKIMPTDEAILLVSGLTPVKLDLDFLSAKMTRGFRMYEPAGLTDCCEGH